MRREILNNGEFYIMMYGQVAERSKAWDCKSHGREPFSGSNPLLPKLPGS